MIALLPGARIYLACGITDMRRGMASLAMLVQQELLESPFDGALYVFRGRRAGLIKLLWHDGVGLCLLTKKRKRCGGRRSAVRGDEPTDDALRAGEDV